jgi:hypothetical protein
VNVVTVLLVLLFFALFLTIDFVKTAYDHRKLDALYRSTSHGTMITTPGFELLGCLAQDGPTVEEPEVPVDKK